MNIILVTKKNGATINFSLLHPFSLFIVFIIFSLPLITYFYGISHGKDEAVIIDFSHKQKIGPIRNELQKIVGSIYKEELLQQRNELNNLQQYNQKNISVLTNNLAKLQAHIIRLDALGSRLISVAHLDKKAFNFDHSPSIGGSLGDDSNIFDETHFLKRMKQLSLDIAYKSKQLEILETLLFEEQLKLIVTPSGYPTEKGWISSYFGLRKDPFSGKRKMHKGVDIAGESGSSVIATAAGIVTKVQTSKGYGRVLDIDHGYGVSTRYGHNQTIKVKIGDVVEHGQLIATMGSTGRSTGPHIHYEVLRNGKQVNPKNYLKTTKK